MDIKLFFDRIAKANEEQNLGLYGIAANRDGIFLGEHRFMPDIPHPMYSLSKSFVSVGMGIARDEGLLSFDDRVIDYFPEFTPKDANENLQKLTIKHLLTMSCGRIEPALKLISKEGEPDPVEQFLHAQPEREPGTVFNYDSGCTYMLGAIVQKITGQKMQDYLIPRLFLPLGIEELTWSVCSKGRTLCGSGLFLRTKQILPYGQMLLDGGVYNGRRLVSEDFIKEASMNHISTEMCEIPDKRLGYGYQFWMARENAYRASGAYAQGCLVIPKYGIVITYTAWNGNLQGILDAIWDNIAAINS